MAQLMGRDRTTLWREVRRNSCHELASLATLGDWAAAVEIARAVYVDLAFRGMRAPLVVRDLVIEEWALLASAEALG